MEKIYNPVLLNATDNINLNEHFKKFSAALFDLQKTNEPKSKETVSNKIYSVLNYTSEVSQNMMKRIESACSIDQLTVSGEPEIIKSNITRLPSTIASVYKQGEITQNALSLSTMRRKRQHQENLPRRSLYKRMHIDMELPPPDTDLENDLTPGVDFVVYFRFFQPFKYNYGESYKDILKFDHEVVLLSSNTLTDLRDKICCSSDLCVYKDISENPEQTPDLPSANVLYPSGFFFIDGTFYNDFRKENAIDYSEVIRSWATDKKIGDFKTAEMKDVKVGSLSPRIGYPYVYQHQGCCEHLFMISTARLLSHSDSLNSSIYPYYSCIGGQYSTVCTICANTFALWMVVDSDRIPKDKSFLCSDCFKSYMYIDGKKIGNFKAYKYVHRNALL